MAEWYKQAFGSYPYSVDVLDVLRTIPQSLLGGYVGAQVGRNSRDAAIKGAVFGAAANALTRAQIALEYSAYQLAAPNAPVYAKTPDFLTHQLFVGAVEALAGAVFSAAFAWLLRR
ncbi:MAG: hypothetical protein QW689_05450 [Nitrososphaerota archaeon]